MSEWSRIQRRFEATLVMDREAQLREERALRSRRALADWFARADDVVLNDLWGALHERAAKLERLGANIEVRPPHPPTSARSAIESRRFVRVRYGQEEVMIYSTRTEVSLTIHWAWALKKAGARFPRILSLPGIRVRRGRNAEMLLEREVEGGSPAVSIPEVACTILGMLADAARTRAQRRSFVWRNIPTRTPLRTSADSAD